MDRAVVEACLPWLGLLAASILLAWALARLSGGRLRLARLRALHRDEKGAVQSLAFVVVLPLFVLIMLFIIQVSQIMIGTVVVHYAAFAAGRAAVVWIPACVGDEPENCIGKRTKKEGTDESQLSAQQISAIYHSAGFGPEDGYEEYTVDESGGGPVGRGGSPKLNKIYTAAVLACMPIAPSRQSGAGSGSGDAAAADRIKTAYLAMSPRSASNPRIKPRIDSKLTYAMENTEIEVRFFHSKKEPPLLNYWYVGVTDDLGQPIGYFANEMGWQDQIAVTVHHKMALLPGPGRFLARKEKRLAYDEVAETIQQEEGVYKYPLSASATLGNEGEKSVIRYVHDF